MEISGKSILGFLIGLGFIACLVLLGTFVDYTLWNWFMPVLFHAPHLLFKQSLALSTVITSLTFHMGFIPKEQGSAGQYFKYWFVQQAYVFLVGLVAHLWL